MGLFGRDRIKDPVAGEAKLLELAPTRKGARQSGRLDVESRLRLADAAPDLATRARASAAAAQRGDSAGAVEALGFELRGPDG